MAIDAQGSGCDGSSMVVSMWSSEVGGAMAAYTLGVRGYCDHSWAVSRILK